MADKVKVDVYHGDESEWFFPSPESSLLTDVAIGIIWMRTGPDGGPFSIATNPFRADGRFCGRVEHPSARWAANAKEARQKAIAFFNLPHEDEEQG